MLKKLSLYKKLIIANVLYSIPVVALIYLMVAAQNVNIDFGVQEKKGNLIQRPVEKLLELTLNLRSGFESDLVKFSEKANLQITEVEKELQDVGGDLQFDIENLKKKKT